MRYIRASVAITALLVSALQPGPAAADVPQHCAVWLEPSSVHGDVIVADLVDLGCYATYSEALEVGSGGAVVVEDSATSASLTDQALGGDASASSSVVIGTEWDETGFASSSRSYFASATCSTSLSWEVGYVTDTWNDRFESGKGFGGCDRNRKFQHSQFGGTSVLCTPNCSTYGSLNNEVSSLRWTH
jgi:hypothetical protein